MKKRLLIICIFLFTLLLSSQVGAANAQIVPKYDKQTKELISIDYPISATRAIRDKNIWKYSVEDVHFKITLKDGTSKTVTLDFDYISNMKINTVNYGGRLDSYVSINMEKHILSKLDEKTLNAVLTEGYDVTITSTIYIIYYDKNGNEDVSKRIVCDTLEKVVDAMQRIGFSKQHQKDMENHFPKGKIPAPPKPGDLILSDFSYPKFIIRNNKYSYSYIVQNTFFENKVSNLYSSVKFKDKKGAVISESTDNIIPYSMGKSFKQKEGDTFSATNSAITNATIVVHLDPIANELSTKNNHLEATIPVFDEGDIPNLKANNYVGDTYVKSAQSTIKVGINVTNESKSKYNGVDFEVKVDGKVVSTKPKFKYNIEASSKNINYTTTINTPSIGAHKVTVTVNPRNNNPIEIDTDDNTVETTIIVSPGNTDLDLVAISYDGETNVPKLQDNIKVEATIDNKSDYTDYNQKVIINFGGKNYTRTVTIVPGQNKYNLGLISSPKVVGNWSMIITVNPDNIPKETNTTNNTLKPNITIFESTLPPTPNPPTFDMSLNINGSGNVATVKSGYGIPIEVDITNFAHKFKNIYSDNDCKLDMTKTQIVDNFRNFNITSSSKAELFTNTSSGFTFSRLPDGKFNQTKATLEATKVNGQTAKIQLISINGKRYIYTDPKLPDGTYEIVVDVDVRATWEEQYRWWNPHNSVSRTCGETSHTHSTSCYDKNHKLICGKYEHSHWGNSCSDQPGSVGLSQSHTNGCYTFTGGWNYFWANGVPIFEHQQLKGKIIIKGSMFDDDGVIISK